MFKSETEIIKSLTAFDFADNDAQQLAGTARPAYWLETLSQIDKSAIPDDLTRIGGQPLLPNGVEWPWRDPYPDLERRVPQVATWDDQPQDESNQSLREHLKNMRAAELATCSSRRPLSFVAQLDLNVLNTGCEIHSDLPDSGRLLLFYDYEQQPWGYAPEDSLGLRLIWDDSPMPDLAPRQPPQELDQTQFDWSLELDPSHLQRHFCMVPMLPYLDALDEIEAYRRNKDRYMDWYLSLQDDGRPTSIMGHRFGGWPSPVQGPMQRECQLVSNGLYLGGGASSQEEEEERSRLARGALDWVFLFQIASDDGNGYMFGDNGIIYVWIHRDDLRSRRFDQARLILQCY